MKISLLLVTSALVGFGVANAEESKEGFAEHKAQMIQNLDARIQNLQTAKSCISAAQDMAAGKKCHETLHEAQKALESQHLDKRMQRLEERKEKLERKRK